jgi:hypothetical protein
MNAKKTATVKLREGHDKKNKRPDSSDKKTG